MQYKRKQKGKSVPTFNTNRPSIFDIDPNNNDEFVRYMNITELDESLKEISCPFDQLVRLLNSPYYFPLTSEKLKDKIRLVSAELNESSSTKEVEKEFIRMLVKTGLEERDAKSKANSWVAKDREVGAHDDESQFLICFALGLKAWEARGFLIDAFKANVYNFRSIKQVIYSFCLQYEFTYAEARRVLVFFLGQPYLPDAIKKPDFKSFQEQSILEHIDNDLAARAAFNDFSALSEFLFSAEAKSTFNWIDVIIGLLKTITNESYTKGLKKTNWKSEVSALIGRLEESKGSCETKGGEATFMTQLVAVCGTKERGESLKRFINDKCWDYLLDEFLKNLDDAQRLTVEAYAYSKFGEDINELTALLIGLHKNREDVVGKSRQSAKRNATTEAINNVMEAVLNSGTFLNKEALEAYKKCTSVETRSDLANSFINLLREQDWRGSFIGYSKTAYGEYLVMKRDIIHRIIRKCLRDKINAVRSVLDEYDCLEREDNKRANDPKVPSLDSMTNEKLDKPTRLCVRNFWSVLFSERVNEEADPYNDHKECFSSALGKEGFVKSWNFVRATGDDKIERIINGLLDLIRNQFYRHRQHSSFEPLRGLYDEVMFLGRIVSNVQIARYVYLDIGPSSEDAIGNGSEESEGGATTYDPENLSEGDITIYDPEGLSEDDDPTCDPEGKSEKPFHLFHDFRSGVSGEIKTSELGQRGVKEWPNIGDFNKLDKDPSLIANPTFARSILYLQRFFYHATIPRPRDRPIKPSADCMHDTRNYSITHGKDRLYSFYSDLNELSNKSSLAYPWPGREFDYLLMRAIDEMAKGLPLSDVASDARTFIYELLKHQVNNEDH